MNFDLLVFIGRFQPVHNGHLAVIRQALEQADQVLVLAGSANRPRTLRDPFTAAERAEMIRACLTPAEAARVVVQPLQDALYNDAAWIRNVHRAVYRCLEAASTADEPRIGLVGHSKDKTSYYLKLFPTWGAVDVPNHGGLNATALREQFFGSGTGATATPELTDRIPAPVCEWLAHFAGTRAYADLIADRAYIDGYRAQFAGLRHPPTFNTADAVVIQSGHVLLVRRNGQPGRGLLALPGGFINGDEPAMEAALRELGEETGLGVPEPTLRSALTGRDFFDDPHRSTRGRTFTFAFRFDLPGATSLAAVTAGDDAAQAMWVPLAKVRPEEMFEDHFFILQRMVGL